MSGARCARQELERLHELDEHLAGDPIPGFFQIVVSNVREVFLAAGVKSSGSSSFALRFARIEVFDEPFHECCPVRAQAAICFGESPVHPVAKLL